MELVERQALKQVLQVSETCVNSLLKQFSSTQGIIKAFSDPLSDYSEILYWNPTKLKQQWCEEKFEKECRIFQMLHDYDGIVTHGECSTMFTKTLKEQDSALSLDLTVQILRESLAHNPWQFIAVCSDSSYTIEKADSLIHRFHPSNFDKKVRTSELFRVFSHEYKSGKADRASTSWIHNKPTIHVAKGIKGKGFYFPKSMALMILNAIHGDHPLNSEVVSELIEKAGASTYLSKDVVYCSKEDYENMKTIAKTVKTLLTVPIDNHPVFEIIEDPALTLEQKNVLDFVHNDSMRLSILTGAAGTGKTWTIKSLVDSLRFSGHSRLIYGCALSWQATKVLKSYTGIENCYSIHKLFNVFDIPGQSFEFPESSVFFVDESSQLDLNLLAKILSKVSQIPNSKILFIGDNYQLPPVGEGAPFKELSDCPQVPHFKLTKIHRTDSSHRGILDCANWLRTGEGDKPEPDSNKEGLHVLIRNEREVVAVASDLAVSKWTDESPPLVLAPTNELVGQLNETIRNKLFQGKKRNRHENGYKCFMNGDRVVVCQNFKASIKGCGSKEEEVQVFVTKATYGSVSLSSSALKTIGTAYLAKDFGPYVAIISSLSDINNDRINVAVSSDNLTKFFDLGYAVTVHKAQGSQNKTCIFVPTLKKHPLLLTRELGYTAVTRAKEDVFIVCTSTDRLVECVHNKAQTYSSHVKESIQEILSSIDSVSGQN
jgi:hypothetical protein